MTLKAEYRKRLEIVGMNNPIVHASYGLIRGGGEPIEHLIHCIELLVHENEELKKFAVDAESRAFPKPLKIGEVLK